MRHPRDWLWDALLGGFLAAFAVLQTLALRYGWISPLSRVLRRRMGIDPETPLRHVTPPAFLAFWVWLTAHLARRVTTRPITPR